MKIYGLDGYHVLGDSHSFSGFGIFGQRLSGQVTACAVRKVSMASIILALLWLILPSYLGVTSQNVISGGKQRKMAI